MSKMKSAQNFMKFGTVLKPELLNVNKIVNIVTCYILIM